MKTRTTKTVTKILLSGGFMSNNENVVAVEFTQISKSKIESEIEVELNGREILGWAHFDDYVLWLCENEDWKAGDYELMEQTRSSSEFANLGSAGRLSSRKCPSDDFVIFFDDGSREILRIEHELHGYGLDISTTLEIGPQFWGDNFCELYDDTEVAA
jgi:hypothetical protein